MYCFSSSEIAASFQRAISCDSESGVHFQVSQWAGEAWTWKWQIGMKNSPVNLGVVIYYQTVVTVKGYTIHFPFPSHRKKQPWQQKSTALQLGLAHWRWLALFITLHKLSGTSRICTSNIVAAVPASAPTAVKACLHNNNVLYYCNLYW